MKINENSKVTLTVGQLKRLIRESRLLLQDEGDDSGEEEFTRALVEISNIVWKTGRQTCPKYLPHNLTAKICLYGYDSDVHEVDVN